MFSIFNYIQSGVQVRVHHYTIRMQTPTDLIHIIKNYSSTVIYSVKCPIYTLNSTHHRSHQRPINIIVGDGRRYHPSVSKLKPKLDLSELKANRILSMLRIDDDIFINIVMNIHRHVLTSGEPRFTLNHLFRTIVIAHSQTKPNSPRTALIMYDKQYTNIVRQYISGIEQQLSTYGLNKFITFEFIPQH